MDFPCHTTPALVLGDVLALPWFPLLPVEQLIYLEFPFLLFLAVNFGDLYFPENDLFGSDSW